MQKLWQCAFLACILKLKLIRLILGRGLRETKIAINRYISWNLWGNLYEDIRGQAQKTYKEEGGRTREQGGGQPDSQLHRLSSVSWITFWCLKVNLYCLPNSIFHMILTWISTIEQIHRKRPTRNLQSSHVTWSSLEMLQHQTLTW